MNRREFNKQLLFGTAFAAVGGIPSISQALSNAKTSGKKPNVLFLFSDQHNAWVMGCAGNPMVKTPNLDTLAEDGAMFSRAYCNDGICLPSRVSMMTGLYPRTSGVLHNSDVPPNVTDLNDYVMANVLRANGYTTGCFGKRHMTRGLGGGWDRSATTINPKQDPSDESYYDWIKKKGKWNEFNGNWKGSFDHHLMCLLSKLEPEERLPAYVKMKTVEFMKEAKKSGKPFFCWSSFLFPHQPHVPIEKWVKLYPEKDIELPANLSESVDNLPPLMQNWRNKTKPPWDCANAAKDHDIYRRYISYYYALVSEVDYQIGKILEALNEIGERENTIIIYSSDHGGFVAAHGMVEKCAVGQNVYEDTMRVPMIFSHPSFKKGVVCDELAELVDIYPTILEMTGTKAPKGKYGLAGTSLIPAVTGKQFRGKDAIVTENWSQSTVITKDYKYGRWNNPKEMNPDYRKFGDMLFVREDDPDEVNNRINDQKLKRVRKEMIEKLESWESRVPDDGKVAMAAKGKARKGKKTKGR